MFLRREGDPALDRHPGSSDPAEPPSLGSELICWSVPGVSHSVGQLRVWSLHRCLSALDKGGLGI